MFGCVLLSGCAVADTTRHDKPNIVLIMADDLGYNGLGCYNSTVLETPVLDKLAAEGLRCTDFHSNGAVCSPTRAALMTGRYQQRSGIDGVVKAASLRHVGLDLEERTVAEALKAQGYATAIFGKWHLGYDPMYNPVTQGFDEFRGFVSGNVDQFSFVDQVGYYDWWNQDKRVDDPGYFSKKITDYAIDFIDCNKDKPFFLYLPHAAPHTPIQAPDDPPGRRVTKGDYIPESHKNLSYGKVKNQKQSLVNMVGFMDAQIGRVVDHLEAQGLAEKTLVIFLSDNGPSKLVKNADKDVHQLRGGKGDVYEGGHRVPAIFYWPGKIKAGQTTDQAMVGMDLMPTFMKLAGVTEGYERLDGKDLGPVLFDEKELPSRDLYWFSFGSKKSAIRRGNWKLVENKKDGVGLFDLSVDLAEETDLSGENPELAQSLKAQLDKMKDELTRNGKMKTIPAASKKIKRKKGE
ncbi:MAG: sulfatase-like hydrolase/transferase [Planctomycetota bacterium]